MCSERKSTFQSLARNPIEGYFHGISCCPPAMKNDLISPELRKQLSGYDSLDVLRYHYDRAGTTDPLSRIQYVDIKTYLVDDILVKVDRASMANSLEVRCPLLDHKLMELIAQIPSSLKLRNGQGKYIFKKSLQRILPSEVLTRRKKRICRARGGVVPGRVKRGYSRRVVWPAGRAAEQRFPDAMLESAPAGTDGTGRHFSGQL